MYDIYIISVLRGCNYNERDYSSSSMVWSIRYTNGSTGIIYSFCACR
jgi:hypothetical protein